MAKQKSGNVEIMKVFKRENISAKRDFRTHGVQVDDMNSILEASRIIAEFERVNPNLKYNVTFGTLPKEEPKFTIGIEL
ncbi:MAG: hypothetical protein A2Y24_07440 [Clostridiales bacterium GWE2_32_10]|nr:MAG: hypothetical protein A2Y24_07440 [Clostridiales bacterium GWE2_32_10]HBY20423.1 hypothetical protein [Clostridiales bacterium]